MSLYPSYLLVSSKRYRLEVADRPRMWRVRHDKELPRGIWRPGDPEVHSLFPRHHSEFQKWAQLVSFGMNPWFANMKDRWRDMYHCRFAWANDQGYGLEGDPRADFVTPRDTDKELPRVAALLSGGMLVQGDRRGDWVVVKGLHYNTPVSLEYLKQHPEYWVRGVYAGGTGNVYRMLGDKYDGPPFIHPLIVNNDKGELVVEAWKLQEWTSSTAPDPMKLYL